jgi:hypothetical protein
LFQINSEGSGHGKIQNAAKTGPAIAAKVLSQFPKGEIDEKSDRRAYEDFMRGEQLHTHLMKHKNTIVRKETAALATIAA